GAAAQNVVAAGATQNVAVRAAQEMVVAGTADQAVVAAAAVQNVVAPAAGEHIGGVIADERVVARPAGCILDDDAVGNGDPAVDAGHVGDEAAATWPVLERCGAQIDDVIRNAAVADRVRATGVPYGLVVGARGV